MALTKIIDAVVEPITLEETKTHLRVDGTDQDALIASLITVGRTAAEERMRRTLLPTTWRMTLDSFPDAIKLSMPRIIAVSSIQYIDTEGAIVTLDPLLYSVDLISEPGWILPAYDLDWPDTREQVNAVSVVYTAGYTDETKVPAPIKQWIKLVVGQLYRDAELGSTRPTVGHEFVDGLLDTYRIVEL